MFRPRYNSILLEEINLMVHCAHTFLLCPIKDVTPFHNTISCQIMHVKLRAYHIIFSYWFRLLVFSQYDCISQNDWNEKFWIWIIQHGLWCIFSWEGHTFLLHFTPSMFHGAWKNASNATTATSTAPATNMFIQKISIAFGRVPSWVNFLIHQDFTWQNYQHNSNKNP